MHWKGKYVLVQMFHGCGCNFFNTVCYSWFKICVIFQSHQAMFDIRRAQYDVPPGSSFMTGGCSLVSPKARNNTIIIVLLINYGATIYIATVFEVTILP